MILAVSGLIFVHDHVEHPMELVLDAPMAAHDGIEAFRREGLAEEIAAGLDRRSTIDLAVAVIFPIAFRPGQSWLSWSHAQALTRCNGEAAAARSKERR